MTPKRSDENQDAQAPEGNADWNQCRMWVFGEIRRACKGIHDLRNSVTSMGSGTKRLFGVLSYDNAVQGAILLITVSMAFAAVKSDQRDTNTRLEVQTKRIDETQEQLKEFKQFQQDNHDLLLKVAGKMDALSEKMDGAKK